MTTLFINIKELVQVRDPSVIKVYGNEMKCLPIIPNAFMKIEDDTIKDFGTMESLANKSADKVIDVEGKLILPTWCDSHTHIVYAGNRSGEFVDRINGLSYEEIAKNGGGILNSADLLSKTSFNELYKQSSERLNKIINLGTGAIEIKSGYGLNTNDEIKMLQVINGLNSDDSGKIFAWNGEEIQP